LEASLVTNVVFTASSGDSNYTWSLSNSTLGAFVSITNPTAIYQNTTNVGVNILTVTDSSNYTASATITQE